MSNEKSPARQIIPAKYAGVTPGGWNLIPVKKWPFGVKVIAGEFDILSQDAYCHSTEQKTRLDCEMARGFNREDCAEAIQAIKTQDANALLISDAPRLAAAVVELRGKLAKAANDFENIRRNENTDDWQAREDKCLASIAVIDAALEASKEWAV